MRPASPLWETEPEKQQGEPLKGSTVWPQHWALSHSRAVWTLYTLQRATDSERVGGGERKRGTQGGREGGGCITLSAGDERRAGEGRSDVISAWCKAGWHRSIPICTHTIINTHAHTDTHPLADFDMTLWRACVSIGWVRQIGAFDSPVQMNFLANLAGVCIDCVVRSGAKQGLKKVVTHWLKCKLGPNWYGIIGADANTDVGAQ